MGATMTPDQQQHLEDIIAQARSLISPKYERGAIEHQSKLWEYTDEELEAEELNEIIDLLVYRMARILKRAR